MKNVFILIAAMAVATSVSMANTKNDNPDKDFSVLQEGTTVKVFYKSAHQENVTVSISYAGERIFEERLKNTTGFLRPYNFSNLSEGEYVIKLDDGISTYSRSVKFSSGMQSGTVDIASVSGESNKFLLRVAKNAGSFTLRITSNDGKVLYNESRNIRNDFAQVYNTSKLPAHIVVEVWDEHGNLKKRAF